MFLPLWFGREKTSYQALVDDDCVSFLLRMSPRWSISGLREPDGVPRLSLGGEFKENGRLSRMNIRMNRIVLMLAGTDLEFMEKYFDEEQFEEFYRAYNFLPRIRPVNGSRLDCRFENLGTTKNKKLRQIRAAKYGTDMNYIKSDEEITKEEFLSIASKPKEVRDQQLENADPDVKEKVEKLALEIEEDRKRKEQEELAKPQTPKLSIEDILGKPRPVKPLETPDESADVDNDELFNEVKKAQEEGRA